MVWAALAGHFHFSVTLSLFGDELPPPPATGTQCQGEAQVSAGAVAGAGGCVREAGRWRLHGAPRGGQRGGARRPLSCSPRLFLPSLPALRFKWGSN